MSLTATSASDTDEGLTTDSGTTSVVSGCTSDEPEEDWDKLAAAVNAFCSSGSDDDASTLDNWAAAVVAKQHAASDEEVDSDAEFAELQTSMSQLLLENADSPPVEGGDGAPQASLGSPRKAAAAATAVAMAAVAQAQDDARAYLEAADAKKVARASGAAQLFAGTADDDDDDDFESLQTLMELVCSDDVAPAAESWPSPSIRSDSSPEERPASADVDPIPEATARRFYAAQEAPFREIILDVLPLGIAITHGDESTFMHLLTMLSWRVHRTASGQAVGLLIVTANQDRDMVFLTQDGPEICELLLVHAQNFKAATSVLPATQRDGLQLVPTTMRPLTMESLADDIALLEMEMDDRDSSRLDAVQAAAQAEMAEQRVQLQAQVGMMEFSIKAALAEASAAEESLLWEVDALEDQVSEEAQKRQQAEQQREAEVSQMQQQQARLQAELEAWAEVEAGYLARAQMQTAHHEATAAQIAQAEAAALEFDRVACKSPPVREAVPKALADHVLAGDIDVSGTWDTFGTHGGTSIENALVLTRDAQPRAAQTVAELQGLMLEVENVEDVLRVVAAAGVLPAAIEWARGEAHTRNAALQLMAAHLTRNPPPTFSGHCAEQAGDGDDTPAFRIVNGMVLRSAAGAPSVCFTQRFEEDEWSTGGDVFWTANLFFSGDELSLREGRWAGMGMNGGSWVGNRLPVEWPEEWDGCLNGARTSLDLENWAMSDAELQQVAALLPRLCKLQTINLSGNEITDVRPLAEALPALPRLTKLMLTVNMIADVSPLVAVLPRLPRLRQLLLDGNMISDVSNLQTVLPKLHNLQMLDLSDNRISLPSRELIETAFRGSNLFLEPQMARGADPILAGIDVPEARGHSGSEATAVFSPQKAAPIRRPKLGQRLHRLVDATPVPSSPAETSILDTSRRRSFEAALTDVVVSVLEPFTPEPKAAAAPILVDETDSEEASMLEHADTAVPPVEEAIPSVTGATTRATQRHETHMLQHFKDCSAQWRPEDSELKKHLEGHTATLTNSMVPPARPAPPEAEAHSGMDRHAVVTPRKAAPLHRPRRRTTGSPQRLAAVSTPPRLAGSNGLAKQPETTPKRDLGAFLEAEPKHRTEPVRLDVGSVPATAGQPETDGDVSDLRAQLAVLEIARNADNSRLEETVSELVTQMEQRMLAAEAEAARLATEVATAEHNATRVQMEHEIQALRKQLSATHATSTENASTTVRPEPQPQPEPEPEPEPELEPEPQPQPEPELELPPELEPELEPDQLKTESPSPQVPVELQQLAKEAASMVSDDVLTSELSLLSTGDGEVTAKTLFMLQREAEALATPRDA